MGEEKTLGIEEGLKRWKEWCESINIVLLDHEERIRKLEKKKKEKLRQ